MKLDRKYKKWLKQLSRLESSVEDKVCLGNKYFDIEAGEIAMSQREIAEVLKTSLTNLHRFLKWSISRNLISTRVINNGFHKLTIISTSIEPKVEHGGTRVFTGFVGDLMEKTEKLKVEHGGTRVFTGVSGGFSVGFYNPKVEHGGTRVFTGFGGVFELKNAKKKVEHEESMTNKGIEADILSKIKNKKVIELLKDHPEVISRNLTRWFNSYEKKKKAKEIDQATSSYPEFTKCISIYHEFFLNRFDTSPMIDAKFGRSLNAIIAAIRTSINNSTTIITPPEHIPIRVADAFKKILSEWDNYSDFIRNNATIESIKGNYNKILSELKLINDGKSTTGKLTKAQQDSINERKWIEANFGAGEDHS